MLTASATMLNCCIEAINGSNRFIYIKLPFCSWSICISRVRSWTVSKSVSSKWKSSASVRVDRRPNASNSAVQLILLAMLNLKWGFSFLVPRLTCFVSAGAVSRSASRSVVLGLFTLLQSLSLLILGLFMLSISKFIVIHKNRACEGHY